MSVASMDLAVIMAGGAGMRLRPYTTVLPKPLMPIGSMPVLEVLLRQLRASGVARVILTVNHLAHLIQAVFGDGSAYDLEISYQVEDRPLGTCGALAALIDRLPDNFLVANGDLLTNYPMRELMEVHLSTSADATIATVRKSVGVEFGVVKRKAAGAVDEYVEKPCTEYEIGIGLYALRRDVLESRLAQDSYADMPTILNRLVRDGLRVSAHLADCHWIDIGQPSQCAQAQELFEKSPHTFLP